MIRLPDTLEKPKLPPNLPASAKWLAGEGAGSWFLIEPAEEAMIFKVSRHAPGGHLECKGNFAARDQFYPDKPFELTYPSHCQKVSVVQEGIIILMNNTLTSQFPE